MKESVSHVDKRISLLTIVVVVVDIVVVVLHSV